MLLKSFNEKNDGESIREQTFLKVKYRFFLLKSLFYGTVVCMHVVEWARPYMHVHYACNEV